MHLLVLSDLQCLWMRVIWTESVIAAILTGRGWVNKRTGSEAHMLEECRPEVDIYRKMPERLRFAWNVSVGWIFRIETRDKSYVLQALWTLTYSGLCVGDHGLTRWSRRHPVLNRCPRSSTLKKIRWTVILVNQNRQEKKIYRGKFE